MVNKLPIRWRLTLWYVVVLAVTMAIVGTIFYAGLRYILYDSLDSNLENQASLVQRTILFEPNGPRIPAGDDDDDDETFVRLTDLRRGETYLVRGDDDVPVNAAGVAAALDDDDDIRWLGSGGDRLRILSVPVERERDDGDDDEIVAVLEVGIESDVEETLTLALQILLALTPVTLIVAGVAGLILARRALQPIDHITRTAESLQERDLSLRITNDLPDDELGRLAATLNAMLDRIEAAFTRQREFTAEAAHELRTPLALMRSQIELALAQPRDPVADRDVLQALNTDLDRVTRLSTALLELARGDARGLELDPEPVDLPELLDLIAEQYSARAGEQGVHLVLESSPVTIRADEDLLVQLMVNLMDNALRHAPAESQMRLGCRAEGEHASIWVVDQGAGIAAEHLPYLFERFYRVERDRDRQRGGAGLGLSICKAIVDAHQGTIVIESEPGQGTTVRVTLPGVVA